MKNLNDYIIEKFKINSTTVKKSKKNKYKKDWSIQTAEDGDFVALDETLLFIYKGLNKDFHVNNAGDDAIVYYATYICDDRKKLEVGVDTGVGGIYGRPERYKLASEEKCKEFKEALKKAGYEWDEFNNELNKI